ncbi:MAG: hypothetical protein Q7R99_01135 [bacterium]|nr:hypothetical protein [bacterium]
MKQIIDITNPDEEEAEETEEQFPIVLASTKPQKKSPTRKGMKKGEVKKERPASVPAELRRGKGKKEIRVSFTLPRLALKIPIVIGVAILLLGGAFLYLTMQAKAEISVKPLLEPITIKDEIQVSFSQAQIDFEKKIIPGNVIEKEVEKWETFKSTGKETEQSGATGAIFVYNNINPPMPLNLKAGTRFISSKDGKVYRAKNKISLPQATLFNGKLTPSITEVQVVADQEGEEYNIAPAKFSIPGLTGTALYYNVWGESREKIDGGGQKEVDQVTQGDMDNAQESLIRELKKMAVSGLKEQTTAGFSFNQESVDYGEPEFSCSQAVGANLAEFNCYAKIKAKTIVFKGSDLQDMAKSFIDTKLSSSKKLYEQSLATSVVPKGSITEKGSLIFNLKTDAKLYNDIDQTALIADLAGKSKEDMEILLNNSYPQIERLDTQFWPFWIKRAPKSLDKIKIEMVF